MNRRLVVLGSLLVACHPDAAIEVDRALPPLAPAGRSLRTTTAWG